MGEKFERFFDLIDKKLKCYKELLELTRKEKGHLRNWDMEAIKDIVKEKERILSTLKELEQSQESCQNILPQSNSTDLATQHYSFLRNTREETKQVMAELREMNKKNILLIEKYLDYIKGMINIFVTFAA